MVCVYYLSLRYLRVVRNVRENRLGGSLVPHIPLGPKINRIFACALRSCRKKYAVAAAKRSTLAGARIAAGKSHKWRSVQASSQHPVGDALNELDPKAAPGALPAKYSSRDDPLVHPVAGLGRSERPSIGVDAASVMHRSRDTARHGWRSKSRRRPARGASCGR